MKFRSDFVTNSSSDSFTVFQVILKDGMCLEKDSPEEFALLDTKKEMEETLSQIQIQSVQDLCQWLYDLNDNSESVWPGQDLYDWLYGLYGFNGSGKSVWKDTLEQEEIRARLHSMDDLAQFADMDAFFGWLCDGLFDVDSWKFTKEIQNALGNNLDKLAAVRIVFGEACGYDSLMWDDAMESHFGLRIHDLDDICEDGCQMIEYKWGSEIWIDFMQKMPAIRIIEENTDFSVELTNGIRAKQTVDGKISVWCREEHAILSKAEVQAFVERALTSKK